MQVVLEVQLVQPLRTVPQVTQSPLLTAYPVSQTQVLPESTRLRLPLQEVQTLVLLQTVQPASVLAQVAQVVPLRA